MLIANDMNSINQIVDAYQAAATQKSPEDKMHWRWTHAQIEIGAEGFRLASLQQVIIEKKVNIDLSRYQYGNRLNQLTTNQAVFDLTFAINGFRTTKFIELFQELSKDSAEDGVIAGRLQKTKLLIDPFMAEITPRWEKTQRVK